MGFSSLALTGGGIDGAIVSSFLAKTATYIVRKSQAIDCEKELADFDKMVEKQAQIDFETYGYCAPGF